jgi:hypothetical protein
MLQSQRKRPPPPARPATTTNRANINVHRTRHMRGGQRRGGRRVAIIRRLRARPKAGTCHLLEESWSIH